MFIARFIFVDSVRSTREQQELKTKKISTLQDLWKVISGIHLKWVLNYLQTFSGCKYLN